MTTRLLRMIASVQAVRRDTRTWVQHLTGEGPATIRRQREAVAHALAVAPLAPSARRTLANERNARPETRPMAAVAGRRPVLTTR